jgi:hypothetical protein
MTEVEYYLDMARKGDATTAFHGLLDLTGDPFPALREAFRAESDWVVRALIVSVITPLKRPEVVEFLGTALNDPHPEVWKMALDGLVSNASTASLRIVEQAKEGAVSDAPERLAWIPEAIEQIKETLAAQSLR